MGCRGVVWIWALPAMRVWDWEVEIEGVGIEYAERTRDRVRR